MTHTCKPTLRYDATGVDGQKYTCPCGKAWEYVLDDGELGSYWVPFIKNVRDETERAEQRRKQRREAQQVWSK